MIGILCRLGRVRLALLNGVAATGGYLLFPAPAATTAGLAAFCGVALLAAGGSAGNQVLERNLDRFMMRTRNRPLPRNELSVAVAVVISVTALLAGLLLLGAVGGPLPVLLGSAALLCYLAVYTPLKRRTPFALVVGAVSGATPPVIGWCLAGGSPTDFRVMLLAGLLYLWQIPHFRLLQRRHADDYRRAGLPLFDSPAVGGVATGLSRIWIVALIAGTMLLPAFGIIENRAPLWMAAIVAPLLVMVRSPSEAVFLPCLNLFPLLLALALFAQK
jgi:protoheme IX farnesyltransferase